MIPVIREDDSSVGEAFFARLRARAVMADAALSLEVTNILEDVRTRGDEALIEYSSRFDNENLEISELRVSSELLAESAAKCEPEVLDALREAIVNVSRFHERQKEASWRLDVGNDSWVGQRITPIEIVGLYVPGGTAAYPSSVIMNVVPAQIAGVPRIIVSTPPATIRNNPAVAAALLELNITEVYGVGGAQAIAAMAFGTATIPCVDKITGPGNKYVATAKKLVFGHVGIDSIAGPSEVVIVADETARPDFVAADLLAQAEHGEDASAILITPSELLAESVNRELSIQMATLSRSAIVAESLRNCSAVLLVEDLAAAVRVVDELAPEHVELMTNDNERIADSIRHAGAIFYGSYSPESLGDYLAGPNHVLPTNRTARFSSALGVYDFVRRTSLISYSENGMLGVAQKIASFAGAEGLTAHARSASIRTEKEQTRLDV
jgi:histidinol dehydrogenase